LNKTFGAFRYPATRSIENRSNREASPTAAKVRIPERAYCL